MWHPTPFCPRGNLRVDPLWFKASPFPVEKQCSIHDRPLKGAQGDRHWASCGPDECRTNLQSKLGKASRPKLVGRCFGFSDRAFPSGGCHSLPFTNTQAIVGELYCRVAGALVCQRHIQGFDHILPGPLCDYGSLAHFKLFTDRISKNSDKYSHFFEPL